MWHVNKNVEGKVRDRWLKQDGHPEPQHQHLEDQSRDAPLFGELVEVTTSLPSRGNVPHNPQGFMMVWKAAVFASTEEKHLGAWPSSTRLSLSRRMSSAISSARGSRGVGSLSRAGRRRCGTGA